MDAEAGHSCSPMAACAASTSSTDQERRAHCGTLTLTLTLAFTLTRSTRERQRDAVFGAMDQQSTNPLPAIRRSSPNPPPSPTISTSIQHISHLG